MLMNNTIKYQVDVITGFYITKHNINNNGFRVRFGVRRRHRGPKALMMQDYWHDLGSKCSETHLKRDTMSSHLSQSFTYVFSHSISLTLSLSDEQHFNAKLNLNACHFGSLCIFCLGYNTIRRGAVRRLIVLHPRQNI